MNTVLNPRLFSGDKLKPDVRKSLLEIAKDFLSELPDFEINVSDIVLLGSNASYNYTRYSDLDLHIVMDLARIAQCNPPEILQYLFNSERLRYNESHDITVKGIEVEVYVEDIRAGTISNGIYSVLRDEWVKFPQKESIPEVDMDEVYNSEEYQEKYVDIINALESEDTTSSDISQVLDSLYLMRKQGLESEGEYGLNNLIYKELRGEGFIDALRDRYNELRSEELTLEGVGH